VHDPTNPALLSEEGRADEVAVILARGYLRHRRLRATPQVLAAPPGAPGAPDASRSRENELDGPGDQSVHVRHAEGA
jgi:hypothetical protein